MQPGRERSAFYAADPERWSQHEALCALWEPTPVVYTYLTDVYRNGTAASLLVDRIAEAEYVVLPLGAFLRAVQYGPIRRFGNDQTRSACAC